MTAPIQIVTPATIDPPADQTFNGVGMISGVINGQTVAMTAAVLKASVAANPIHAAHLTVYTFTKNFTHIYNNQTLSYRKGASYPIDSVILPVLLAANAPMVLA